VSFSHSSPVKVRFSPDEPASTDRPPTDTSTDWDEWMEKHGGRPRPRPDVADREGKLTDEK